MPEISSCIAVLTQLRIAHTKFRPCPLSDVLQDAPHYFSHLQSKAILRYSIERSTIDNGSKAAALESRDLRSFLYKKSNSGFLTRVSSRGAITAIPFASRKAKGDT